MTLAQLTPWDYIQAFWRVISSRKTQCTSLEDEWISVLGIFCCAVLYLGYCKCGVFFYYFLFFLLSYILIWLIMVCVLNRRVYGFNIFAVISPTFISIVWNKVESSMGLKFPVAMCGIILQNPFRGQKNTGNYSPLY